MSLVDLQVQVTKFWITPLKLSFSYLFHSITLASKCHLYFYVKEAHCCFHVCHSSSHQFQFFLLHCWRAHSEISSTVPNSIVHIPCVLQTPQGICSFALLHLVPLQSFWALFLFAAGSKVFHLSMVPPCPSCSWSTGSCFLLKMLVSFLQFPFGCCGR